MASSPQDNVLLFGLGAVGAVYAFIAARAPNTKVYVCARSNFEVVSTQGLNMKSEKFGDHPNFMFAGAVKTPAASSIKDVKFSYIICANKAITMDPPASEQIAPAVSENTTIVLIQNGVGNDEEFP
ncbi:ketopantoate reductase [Flagelloscypha sp. PMI_526]|nr:ketopantoate reductase [Flagelloscypha sp. PMI_526]